MDVKREKGVFGAFRNALLTVLCAAAGIMFLAGCGDSPETVAKKWHAAISEGNQAEADKYVTGSDSERLNKRMIKRISEFEKDAKDNGGLGDHARKELDGWKNLKFEKAKSSGDSATVAASSNGETFNLAFRKVDGKWKLDLEKSFR